MTRQDLIDLMVEAWTDYEEEGARVSGLCDPLTESQQAMLRAQLSAVADGIIAAAGTGVPGSTPQWVDDDFVGTGSTFTLSYLPLANSLMVFRNNLPERGWTRSGRDVTLASPRTSGDASLWMRYQAVVPT
jgi:hypothetical protein